MSNRIVKLGGLYFSDYYLKKVLENKKYNNQIIKILEIK